MKRSISKKAKKVIEKGIEELTSMSSLERITRIGAQMMLQAAIEEEVTAYLMRDYYERNECANGSRSGSKPRTIFVYARFIHKEGEEGSKQTYREEGVKPPECYKGH